MMEALCFGISQFLEVLFPFPGVGQGAELGIEYRRQCEEVVSIGYINGVTDVVKKRIRPSELWRSHGRRRAFGMRLDRNDC